MNIVFSVFVFVLFFILTPGILVTLPKKGSKMVIALVHGVIFATCLAVSKYFFWKSGNSVFEGANTREAKPVAEVKAVKPSDFDEKLYGTPLGISKLMQNLKNSVNGKKPGEMTDERRDILLGKIDQLDENITGYIIYTNDNYEPIPNTQGNDKQLKSPNYQYKSVSINETPAKPDEFRLDERLKNTASGISTLMENLKTSVNEINNPNEMSKKKKTILLVKIAYLNKNITKYYDYMSKNYKENTKPTILTDKFQHKAFGK